MSNAIERYRQGADPIPPTFERWHLRGAGLESLTEESVDLPPLASDQILVRHDACGICFSDIKIINLGPEHPRLVGRDMAADPVVMGHEVALTVVQVGESLKDKFSAGQRFIVQADVYFKGKNVAYGYILDGGMSQYNVIGEEVLRGDEGCYLLPLHEGAGYVEAALVEPWACVVAAYEYPNFRDGVKAGGKTLVYAKDASLGTLNPADVAGPGGEPSVWRTLDSLAGLADASREATGGAGFDDIIVLGSPAKGEVESLSQCLGAYGVMNIASPAALDLDATIDIGRVHYDRLLYIGGVVKSAREAALAYRRNRRSDLLGGGAVWFIGAGGPMGQMHIQRAVMHRNPPSKIVVTDVSDERLARIDDRFGKKAAERGIEIVALNPDRLGEAEYAAAMKQHGPYSDIVCLVPAPALVAQSAPYLAPDGVYNIFAGVAKGVAAPLRLGDILTGNQRFIGTSGSSIADLKHTLDLVEDGTLSTNSSLAAIGGRHAFRDGLAAVRAGKFPGKTVIFLNLDLPLLSIEELKIALPSVYQRLEDGKFWTRDAEEELLRLKLGR